MYAKITASCNGATFFETQCILMQIQSQLWKHLSHTTFVSSICSNRMPKTGQTEQQMSKEVLLVEIESLRKQNEMNRVPMSSALQM